MSTCAVMYAKDRHGKVKTATPKYFFCLYSSSSYSSSFWRVTAIIAYTATYYTGVCKGTYGKARLIKKKFKNIIQALILSRSSRI